MIVNKELAKSKGTDLKDLYETPIHIYEVLNKEFRFSLDPCCVKETAKCWNHFTPVENGLTQSWAGETVFCNPPYSRGNIDKWVRKCYIESLHPFTTVVALLPVSTSSDWWKNWVVGKTEKRWIDKRVRFVGAPYCAPFSSVIVVFGRTGESSFNQQI